MPGNKETTVEATDTPSPAATLAFLSRTDTSGAICSFLTPAIKARLKELQPGQVLLVRVDDLSALLDVPAWCALTGNALQATTEEDNGVINFFIKKGENRNG